MHARGLLAVGLFAGHAAAQEPVWRPASAPPPAPIEFRPAGGQPRVAPAVEPTWRTVKPAAAVPAPEPKIVPVQAVLPLPAAVAVHSTPVVLKPLAPPPEPPKVFVAARPVNPEPNPLPIMKPAATLPVSLPPKNPVVVAARQQSAAPAPSAPAKNTIVLDTRTQAVSTVPTVAEPVPLFTTTAAESRFHVRPEFLYWWYNRGSVPVLASTGPGFGYLSDPDTVALLGPGGFGPDGAPGFRVRGSWQAAPLLAVDAGYFFLGKQSTERSFASEEYATVTRPFYAPNFGTEYGELTSYPGLSSGSLTVRQSTELWGAELNAKRGSYFAGYRHLNMTEDLSFAEVVVAGANAPQPVGTRVNTNESFGTKNRFHGGQVGWTGATNIGRVNLDGRASVAFGVTRQTIDIQGEQRVLRPSEPEATFSGGLLAAGPNLGRHTQDKFSVAPEAGVSAGLELGTGVRVFVGYNVIAWTGVARPGNQIDRTIDLTFVPNAPAATPAGERRPAVPFDSTTFWAQGMQVGLDVRW